MSCYLIVYGNSGKECYEVKSKEEYLKLRGRRRHNEDLMRARGGDKRAKSCLLQFNYSCIPGDDRRLKGCKTASTSVGMDIDEMESMTMDELGLKILQKREELGLLMLERSVSKGYHVIFRRKEELSQEENLRWASELLGVPFDSNAKDITRVFYATSDKADDLMYVSDELFENRKAEESGEKEEGSEAGEKTRAEEGKEERGGETMAAESVKDYPAEYKGKSYEDIVVNLQELMGGAPEHGSRNQFIFAMACQLRHICNDDWRWVAKVLPTYGEEERKWMETIKSACNRNQTMGNPRLLNRAIEMAADARRDVDWGRKESRVTRGIDRKKLPMGIRESAMSVSPEMLMPVLITVCPMIGALATNVKVSVHGQMNTMNLLSYVVGNAASGKGSLDAIVEAWMKELQAQDDVYHEMETAYRKKKREAKNQEKQPNEPKLPVRYLTFNNTVANISERLSNTGGKHSFSFTPEADTVAQRWKSSMSDYSVMLRQAYDASRYDREAKSAEAVTVHIKKLLWNVVMCGTKDAMYRVISNCTDGLLTRFAIASTPDNTYAPLSRWKANGLREQDVEKIVEVSHLLQAMEGELNLPKLEARGERWLEKVRLKALKDDDRTMASQRMRICVTTQRMMTGIMLCAVAGRLIREYGMATAEKMLKGNPALLQELTEKEQKGYLLEMFDYIADMLMENVMTHFRERIENATAESHQEAGNGGRLSRGKNDSIYDSLPMEFTYEQATIAKGNGSSANSVKMMLRNWMNQGLVEKNGVMKFKKL